MQKGTTDIIFVVYQPQGKYIATNKQLYFAFIDLQKTSDFAPRNVLWWALRSLDVKEWAAHVIQGMYSKALRHVQVSGQYSEEFGMGIGAHQGSGPLLFVMVLEALSRVLHWYAMGTSLCWWPGTHWGHPCRRSVSPSSRHGRLAWKVKGSMSTWRRSCHWSLMLAMIS